MGTEKNNARSLLQKIRQTTQQQKTYGGNREDEPAKVTARTCPNCGAGRAQGDGLTHCAYCGFGFLSVTLGDGIHIKKEDNSQTGE